MSVIEIGIFVGDDYSQPTKTIEERNDDIIREKIGSQTAKRQRPSVKNGNDTNIVLIKKSVVDGAFDSSKVNIIIVLPRTTLVDSYRLSVLASATRPSWTRLNRPEADTPFCEFALASGRDESITPRVCLTRRYVLRIKRYWIIERRSRTTFYGNVFTTVREVSSRGRREGNFYNINTRVYDKRKYVAIYMYTREKVESDFVKKKKKIIK